MHIAVIGSGTRSDRLPPWLEDQALADGLTARIVNPRLSGFAFTPYERLVVDLGFVDAAQSAAADSDCGAVLLNSFADYGIEAARAAVPVPVVGAGEAAIVAASAGGTRPFAIVTVWPESLQHLYDERLRSVPGGHRCIGVRRIGTETELAQLADDSGVMQRMARHESAVIEALRRECEAAVREDGAQAIALGCTCMAPIGPALAATLSVPVYESSRVGLAAALRAAAQPTRNPGVRNPALVPQVVAHALGAVTLEAADCALCADLTQRETSQ